MDDEFENALAWFRSAPTGWIESAKKDLSACAEWIWEVLQGDFNDNASTAQVVTGTVISMIPFVDQLCDVRDVVANSRKIDSDPNNTGHWVALVLTLIGLFPTLGSLLKGCGKVLFAGLRKAGYVSGAAPQLTKCLDASIVQLDKFLARPEIVATLKALEIDNPYKYTAKGIRAVAKKLNTSDLLSAFDKANGAADSLMNLVKRWGGTNVANAAGELLRVIGSVRNRADRMLGKAIRPVQDILDRTARRLDIAADQSYRAHLNAVNPHAFARVRVEAELAAFKAKKASWVDETGALKYPEKTNPPEVEGWRSPNPTDENDALYMVYKTFHTMEPKIYPPGTKFYRIVDPNSSDDSICWMSEAEFLKLKSKADWRRTFAVWANWNRNGEYVTYTVPSGPGMKVWEGKAASQEMNGTKYVLEGGATQIVIHPDDLEISSIGPRQKTGWGYDDFGETTSLVGVPVQKNKLREKVNAL